MQHHHKNLKLVKLACKYKKNILRETRLQISKSIYSIKKAISEDKKIMFGYIYIFNNYIKYIKNFIDNKKNGEYYILNFKGKI